MDTGHRSHEFLPLLTLIDDGLCFPAVPRASLREASSGGQEEGEVVSEQLEGFLE